MKLTKKFVKRGAIILLGVGIISGFSGENSTTKENKPGEVAGALSTNLSEKSPTVTQGITSVPSATVTLTPSAGVSPTPIPTNVPTFTPKPTLQKVNTPTSTPTPILQVSCKYQCSGADVVNCDDFGSQQEAQAYFNCCGHSATNDPMGLDDRGIGNGLACDGYRY